jgi:hypothetical protein
MCRSDEIIVQGVNQLNYGILFISEKGCIVRENFGHYNQNGGEHLDGKCLL